MRILFAFVGGNGHFEPLVPIARAAAAAGHTVAVVGRPDMVAAVEAAGFPAFAIGDAVRGAPPRIALQPLDPEREDRDLREGFARRAARERATGLLALAADQPPDLIVCDEMDFGAMVAAERLGLPYASVLSNATSSFVRAEVVGEPLHELRAAHGLPPDPQLTMLSRHLVLSPFPPSLRDPAHPPPATAHSFRPAEPSSPAGRRTDVSTVYFTLGTVFNVESGDLFARVLAGLGTLPVNLIVTVGPHIDPDELGPQPTNVHIRQYIPQGAVLPGCDAVVSHGGSGTLIGALAHGLPAVLIPMGADQPGNAARCAELGVARVLDPIAATPQAIREAVLAVLTEPGYRQAAERLRDEMAALPGPEYAVRLLERLVTQR